MSEENVEIVRRAFERWMEGGGTVDAIPAEGWAEDMEWNLSAYPVADLPSRGSGRDNVFRVFAEYLSGWKSYRPEATEFIDAGDDVIVVLHEAARVGDSGSLLERDVFQVWTLRDGLVVKWRVFETREEALDAAGLRD